MKVKDHFFSGIVIAVALILAIGMPDYIHAEIRQTPIITLEKQRDFVVLFTFEREMSDLTFLSPSGEKLTAADSGVEVVSGELWSTYRITDAQAGTWSVEYDAKEENRIEYSIIEEDYGLWIQNITVTNVEAGQITISFQADCENHMMNYQYDIFAVPVSDAKMAQKLISGQASSNSRITEQISLLTLPDGTYQFRLEVYCKDGDMELFDAMCSDSFDFVNSEEPKQTIDYCVYMDEGNLECEMILKDQMVGSDAYRLVVYGDNEVIYEDISEGDFAASKVSFPQDTKELEILLYQRSDGIWSAPEKKGIDLTGGEYLRTDAKDVTGSSQIALDYSVVKERELFLEVNGEESKTYLNGSGYAAVPLIPGDNTIHAAFESDKHIFYVVNIDLYYDAFPPEIMLYEDLDGKNFSGDCVQITGKITGGNQLRANGEAVEVDSVGEFSYLFSLASRENILTLEALDVNGNMAAQTLTLYRYAVTAGSAQNRDGWMQLLPLTVSLLLSIMIVILVVVYLKKRKKAPVHNSKYRMARWILADLLLLSGAIFSTCQFVVYRNIVNSADFLEIAERSIAKAAEMIKIKNLLGIVSGFGIVLLLFFVLFTVLTGKKRKAK